MAKYFILTGIPRSGTTLMCNLANKVSNVVCMNEVAEAYDVPNLPKFFQWTERRIDHHMSIPMDVDVAGELITDTQYQEHRFSGYVVPYDRDKPLFIGSKINWPYLSQMDTIKTYGYKVFAVVRNPVYAIASWNKNPENINEYHVMPDDWEGGDGKWLRYSQFSFRANDRLGRQAEIWNMMAQIILDLGHRNIFWYEHLVSETKYRLMYFCSLLGGAEYDVERLDNLENRNQDELFTDVDLHGIRNAIRQYAPLVNQLGYRV